MRALEYPDGYLNIADAIDQQISEDLVKAKKRSDECQHLIIRKEDILDSNVKPFVAVLKNSKSDLRDKIAELKSERQALKETVERYEAERVAVVAQFQEIGFRGKITAYKYDRMTGEMPPYPNTFFFSQSFLDALDQDGYDVPDDLCGYKFDRFAVLSEEEEIEIDGRPCGGRPSNQNHVIWIAKAKITQRKLIKAESRSAYNKSKIAKIVAAELYAKELNSKELKKRVETVRRVLTTFSSDCFVEKD